MVLVVPGSKPGTYLVPTWYRYLVKTKFTEKTKFNCDRRIKFSLAARRINADVLAARPSRGALAVCLWVDSSCCAAALQCAAARRGRWRDQRAGETSRGGGVHGQEKEEGLSAGRRHVRGRLHQGAQAREGQASLSHTLEGLRRRQVRHVGAAGKPLRLRA